MNVRPRSFNKNPHFFNYKTQRGFWTWNKGTAQVQDEMKTSIDEYGNSALHRELLNFTNIKQLRRLIHDLGEEQISIQARTVNNSGKIPFDLIPRIFCSPVERVVVEKILTPYLYVKKFKPLHEEIDPKVVLATHRPNSELLSKNLELGCLIANEARAKIKYSGTHPDMNQITDQTQIEYEIHKMRSEIKFALKQNKSVSELVKLICRYGVGNCFEFAFLGLHLLQKKSEVTFNQAVFNDKKFFGGIYYIKHGDHVFFAFDQKTNMLKENTSVAVDAWAGDVYPAAHFTQHLKTYRNYDVDKPCAGFSSNVNVITNYNPNYHEIKLENMPEYAKKDLIFENNTLSFFQNKTSSMADKSNQITEMSCNRKRNQ